MTARARFIARVALCVAAACTVAGCETVSQAASSGEGASGYYGAGTSTRVSHTPAQLRVPVFSTFTPQERDLLDSEFAAVILGACPLLPDAQVQHYVNQVGQWLALQVGSPSDAHGRPMAFQWRFAVIVSDAASSFATPGGRVFITAGLLRRLASEAELAAILAHEMAHAMQGDALLAVQQGGFMHVEGAQEPGPAHGAVHAGSPAGVLRTAVTGAMQHIYVQGLEPDAEFAADRQAVRYAVRAGYAPEGLAQVLHMFAAASEQNADFALLRQTHPDARVRLRRLAPLLEYLAGAGLGVGAVNAARFTVVRNRVMADSR